MSVNRKGLGNKGKKKDMTYEDLKRMVLQEEDADQNMQAAIAAILPAKSDGAQPQRALPPSYRELISHRATSSLAAKKDGEEGDGGEGDEGKEKDKDKYEKDRKKSGLFVMGIPSVDPDSDSAAYKLKVSSKGVSLHLHSRSATSEDDEDYSSSLALEEAEWLRMQLDDSMQRALRHRITFHVRHRRSLRESAMASGAAQGRPLPGKPAYFTEGHVPDSQARDVNAEPTPYWMPPAVDELCYRLVDAEWTREQRELRRQLPVWEHHTYRSRRSLDLLRRLHIPREPEDPATLTPGILDIDPDYYSVVEGRPEYTATLGQTSIREYLEDIRNVLKTKLMIGYAEDSILMVKEQYSQEMLIIKEIQDMNQRNVKAFEDFLAEDHQKSMEVLQNADRMVTETQRMEAEIKFLNRQLGKIRCEVYVLEEHWRTVKMLQRFLYAASPAAWRMQYDHEYIQRMRETGSVSSDDFHAAPVTARKMRSDMNLNELIALFNEEVADEVPPQLYFKSAKDLLDVFDNITQLNMDMMTHSEQVRKPLDELYHTLDEARKRMANETERLRVVLAEQHARIDWERRRAAELESDARRLLDEVFKDLIIDDEVIRTLVCVEDAHEACVAPNDSNLTVMEMMRNIERKYESLMEAVDLYPPYLVAQVQKDIMTDEKVRMVRAKVAAKQLMAIRRMEERMHKALQTPPPAGMRPLVFRSPPFVKVVKMRREERRLSTQERKMLLHLTEWCPQTDSPEAYLDELRRTGMLDDSPSE